MAYRTEDLAKHFRKSNIPQSIGGTGPEDLFIKIQDLQRSDIVY